MIKIIIDDVLDNYSDLEDWIQKYASFYIEDIDNYKFNVAKVPDHFGDLVIPIVEDKVGSKIDVKYKFLRLYTKYKDTGIRIHSDAMMADYAWVLYFSDPPDSEEDYGTSFFTHHIHGKNFPYDDIEENNRLLVEDSHDIEKWEPYDMCKLKKNRMLIFSGDYFHSRYPFKSWGEDKTDGRMVFVGFFNFG
jgi:hypothetical protein|tara:strand:- start:180 stop:752 length:573 start_codon:yes stop_codon:yes gene_type:complete